MNIKKLGEVARIFNGNSINEKVKAKEFTGVMEGTPYVATKDISYTNQVDYENGVKIPNLNKNEFKKAKKGSVLLCAEGGSAGRKMAIIDRDVFFVNKLFCFECSDQLNSKYLFYYLQTEFFQTLFKDSMTGLIGGVSLEKIRNLPIVLPSLDNQNEIVEKLDSAFAEFDVGKLGATRFLESLSNLLDSKLDEVFSTLGIEFGMVQSGEIIDVRDGTHDSPIYVEFGYPLITSKNLQDGMIDFSKVSFISEEDYQVINKRSKVNVGDLLFAMIGTIGNPVVVTEEPMFAIKNVALFKASPKYNMTFLSYFLRSPKIREKFEREAKGTTQRFLSLGYLRTIDIPNVPVNIQQDVVEKLEQFRNELRKLERNLTQKLEKFAELRGTILSSFFTINSDEEAVV